MSETIVGILGFLCITAIVLILFKSKTLPSIAFIVFPSILAILLVFGGYYDLDNVAQLIKSGFSSTAPTAALFVFSVLYFGIMTDAGMFDVIIGKLMKLVGGSTVGVSVMTCIIALIGHLDGGGASTFCIVVPSMLPVYKKMHMRPTSLLQVSVLAMGVLNLMPWAGPTMRAASVLGIEAGQLWGTLIPIQIFGILLALLHAVVVGLLEQKRGAGLNGRLAREEGEVVLDEQASGTQNDLARPRLFAFNILLTIAVIALLIYDAFPSYVPFMLGVAIAILVNYPGAKMQKQIINSHAGPALMMCSTLMGAAVLMGVLVKSVTVDGAEIPQRRLLYGRSDQDGPPCCTGPPSAPCYRHPVGPAGPGLRHRLLLLRYAARDDRHRRGLRRSRPAHRRGHGGLPQLRHLHQPHGPRHPSWRRTGRCGHQGPHQELLPVGLGLLDPLHDLCDPGRHHAGLTLCTLCPAGTLFSCRASHILQDWLSF